MGWCWAASCRNRGQPGPRFPKRRTPSPRLVWLRRRLDEKPTSESRHLPPPDSGYGLHGLLALQEYQRQRYSIPLNFLDDWQNQINHILAQEEAHRRELPGEVKKALVELSR